MIKILIFLLPLMAFDENEATSLTRFRILRRYNKVFEYEYIVRMQDLEYPKRDCKILAVLYKKWVNYYSCLAEKENQEIKPEIRRLLEGQNTELKCDYCERPFQNYKEIQWKYKPFSAKTNVTYLQYLDLTPQMALTKNRLKIYNAVTGFSGLYVCFQGKTIISIYILEVSKDDGAVKVEQEKREVIQINTLGYNFNVFYQWTNFTECSTCGRVGKKYKYGICYISLPNINDKKVKKLGSHWSLPKNSRSKKRNLQEEKLNEIGQHSTSQIQSEYSGPELIKRFQNGIPCASPYLMNIGYDFFNNFPAVKVLEKYCLENCDKEQIFEVINHNGRIIERANNSAGIYSLFQEIPNTLLGIERSTIVAEFGSNVVIQCPGYNTSRTNTPVVWKTNDKIIYPNVVKNKSNGRFTIDFVQRIHIKSLRLKDGRIYSCWHKDKLVGTVHLCVDKKFGIEFNHRVTLICIALLIAVLLFLGSKILTRELNMRKK